MPNCQTHSGRAMAQAVSSRPHTAEARVRSRVSPCGICGGQSGTVTGFSPSTSVFREPRYLSRYSDSLRAGRSGDRIPVEARFSTPVQTGPGAHPASCTMGNGSFLGVKRPGRGVDHPPPSRPSWPVLG